ncbi:MAG: RsmE family RNA methyltransferase [Thermoanaerobaculia bacterium]
MTTLLLPPEIFARELADLEGDLHHHLFRVKRHRVGDLLRAVDGRGAARAARVVAVDKRSARLALGETLPAHEAARQVDLLVAAPRFERASWLVEKATELGAAAIRFLATERDPRGYGEGNFTRLRRVAASAVEQSGRACLPQVTGPHDFAEIPRLLPPVASRIVLDPGGGSWTRAEGATPVSLAVGPEGGFDPAEREQLLGWGFRPVTLGERILRVETAAIAGCALALTSSPSTD